MIIAFAKQDTEKKSSLLRSFIPLDTETRNFLLSTDPAKNERNFKSIVHKKTGTIMYTLFVDSIALVDELRQMEVLKSIPIYNNDFELVFHIDEIFNHSSAYNVPDIQQVLRLDSHDEKMYLNERAALDDQMQAKYKLAKSKGNLLKTIKASQPPMVHTGMVPSSQVEKLSVSNITTEKFIVKPLSSYITKFSPNNEATVNLIVKERIRVEMTKDGLLKNSELKGELNMFLKEDVSRIELVFDKELADFRYSPNVKQDDAKRGIFSPKSGKFLLNKSLTLMRWTSDSFEMPFSFTFWPSESDNSKTIILFELSFKENVGDCLVRFNSYLKIKSGDVNNGIWRATGNPCSIEFELNDEDSDVVFPIDVYFNSDNTSLNFSSLMSDCKFYRYMEADDVKITN